MGPRIYTEFFMQFPGGGHISILKGHAPRTVVAMRQLRVTGYAFRGVGSVVWVL